MDINSIIKNFFNNVKIINYNVFGNGHINDTYIVKIEQNGSAVIETYILQKINKNIFKKPLEIVNNTKIVCEHIRNKLVESDENDIERKVLTLVPDINGNDVYMDKNNNFWRVYKYIKDTISVDFTNSKTQLYSIASAFGKFLTHLSDLSTDNIFITIPDFHNTKTRYSDFMDSLDKDHFNRKKDIEDEAGFLTSHNRIFKDLEHIINSSIPLRVTHNDTKVNNVMLDKKTGMSLCVVDFDTIMPGYSIFDFGDLVRSAIRNAPECEKDLSKIYVDLDRFKAITEGFLSETKNILTQTEIDNLVTGSIVITMMIGMRFLTDFLNGDKYFKIAYEQHNLDRCRVQLKLVRSMLENKDKMEKIVLAVPDQ